MRRSTFKQIGTSTRRLGQTVSDLEGQNHTVTDASVGEQFATEIIQTHGHGALAMQMAMQTNSEALTKQ